MQAAEFRSSSFKHVWDAAEGLRANVTNGTYANPYSVSAGAIWGYYKSQTALHTTAENLTALPKATSYNGDPALAGFNGTGTAGGGAPHLYVNKTTDGTSAKKIYGNAMFFHPGSGTGSSNDKYVILRFTVPHDGYYSSLSYFKDIDANPTGSSGWGADVCVAIDGVEQVCAVVSAEEKGNGFTEDFTFLSPVRWCAAGTTFDFVVGNNGAHTSDATLVKAEVREETAGCFFDAGRALRENVTNSYVNPCGSTSGGTWVYYQQDTIGGMLEGLLSSKSNLVDSVSQNVVAKGFYQLNGSSANPKIYANTEDVQITSGAGQVTAPSGTRSSWYGTAPNEIFTHPFESNRRSVVRFQPSQAGWYSMEAVFRHINSNTSSDGVDVHIVAGRVDQTNAVICAKAEKQTVRLACGPVLLTAGESVDFVVGPNAYYTGDATAFSAVVRRETAGVTDVWDANRATAENLAQTTPVNPYTDALGGEWVYGYKQTAAGTAINMNTGIFGPETGYHGWQKAAGERLPRICLNVSGGPLTTGMFPMVPNEIFMHPNALRAALRFVAPSGGVYRVKARVHHASLDFNNDNNKSLPTNRDGVWPHLVVNGTVQEVMRKCLWVAPTVDATIFDADALNLAQGDVIDFVVCHGTNFNSDATGVAVCVVPGTGVAGDVVNVNFASADTGKGLSASREYGRVGLTAPVWNALAPTAAGSVSTRALWDQDGVRRWNTVLTVARAGGDIAFSGTADTLDGAGIRSAGSGDVHTVTISKLKPNAAYTLCLRYPAASGGTFSYAVHEWDYPVPAFTIPGATLKWPVTVSSTFAVYENVTADGDGTVSFTFASDAENGAAVVNGLQIAGEFPAYTPAGTLISVR